ncbi:MAG: hypothetical protein ABSG64_05275 [Solirubrobacteraceae bacterium]|jgi:hypothetical protein
MSRSASRLLIVTLVALTPLVLVPVALAKHHHHHHHARAKWSWSRSAIPGTQTQIQGLSCPSVLLCVASGPVDLDAASGGTNNVFWTTNPASGTWQTAPLENAVQPSLSAGPEPIPNVSCPTTTFCAIADGFANLWETNTPTGGGGAWVQSIPTGDAFVGLSCASAVCGGIDVEGHAVALTNDVVNNIHPVFNATEGLSGASISCESGGFCAADDDGGDFAWTTNLISGSWQTATFPHNQSLGSIACPSSGLCVLSGSKLYVSTNPAAGPSSFKAIKGVTPGSISCAGTSFCAIATTSGIEVSTTPASGGWKKVKTPFIPSEISCPQSGVCVITDGGAKAAIGRG